MQQGHVVIELRLVIISGNRFSHVVTVGKGLDGELGTVFAGALKNKNKIKQNSNFHIKMSPYVFDVRGSPWKVNFCGCSYTRNT